MLHTIRSTLRHLSRQKLNTSLHIIGLTLGMSVCLLIGLFLRHELSFDSYHDKADRIFRINSIWIESGQSRYHYSTPMPLVDELRSSVSGLEKVTRTHPVDNAMIEISGNRFMQKNILITDAAFPDIFKIETIRGNVRNALQQPYQAVLTETTAHKFYGSEDPIGKTFRFKNTFDITVAGIIRDLPANTHLPATILLSYHADENFLGQNSNAWTFISGTSSFVLLPEKYDIASLKNQLNTIADKHINSDPHMPKFFRSEFDVQPLSDIHFGMQYAGGGAWVKAVNTSWLWFFAGIGLAVLSLACINFVNLSTAQALNRAKETGIRKSIGADKHHLIFLFLSEAWVLVFFSGVLAVTIAQMTLPMMNTLLEKGITFHLFQSPDLIFILTGSFLITGLLAGLYPAFVITRFNPIASMKRSARTGDNGSNWLRKSLVVTQFTISAGLLMIVILIAQQVNFLRTKNLGFNKDNLINVEVKDALKVQTFATELAGIPQIKDMSFALGAPSPERWRTIMSKTNENDPHRKEVTLLLGDDHYCTLYGFTLLSGRFLTASDTNSISKQLPETERLAKVVVNEELVKALEFRSNDDAIGKRFWIGAGSGKVEVVGVVANFNTNSLHSTITPTIITSQPDAYGQVGIKIEANANVPETIAAIKASWEKVFPDGVFEFKFLDEEIDSMYKAETRLYSLFKVFAGLAMLISCLGLWGLATYSAQQRTKEIGIRKVLGASANAMVLLLSKEFVLMVGVALAISTPLAYYGMKNWLNTFAFRIEIGWPVFVIVGATSLLIALLTVSFQALKAAVANPVDVLKNE